ncbi:MAG: 4-(cytidine 5'-diphospho)-2-C-methyl-D-erythritol kinase [Erythrobacter sp.]
MDISETAYAKINLALHVRRRREDGYHELETLFAFVDAGDVLRVTNGAPETLAVTGEFADAAGPLEANLAWRALKLWEARFPLHVELEKRLPVAAGLGGGSADAAAIIRVLRRFRGAAQGIAPEAIASLGADVPACVLSRTHIGRGTGAQQHAVEDDLAGAPVLLVNPRIPLSTGPVFKAWDGVDRGALPGGSARAIALAGRNDLEAPAISLCPAIAAVLAALRATGPVLARMSGSGATCFALYRNAEARDAAQASMRPEWWTLAGALR